MDQIIDLLLFLVPMYFANSVPVVLGGGKPMDLGATFKDGQRMLGDGKTIRGFVAGVLAGTVAGGIVAYYYQLPFFATPALQFIGAFVLALGTMVGDALGSFIKRRAKVGAGSPFLLDSLSFVIVSLALVYPFVDSSIYAPLNIAFILVLTMVVHPVTNFLANRAGLKKVPW